jgi:reverse transcriptase-like protein
VPAWQQATRIVLEPIFEVDFKDCSFGFRPKRSAHLALQRIRHVVWRGGRWVVDADVQSFFDGIDHDILLRLVARRVSDRQILRLLKAWLRAAVMEAGELRSTIAGTPQGGVISPPKTPKLLQTSVRGYGISSSDSQNNLILSRRIKRNHPSRALTGCPVHLFAIKGQVLAERRRTGCQRPATGYPYGGWSTTMARIAAMIGDVPCTLTGRQRRVPAAAANELEEMGSRVVLVEHRLGAVSEPACGFQRL